MTEDVPSPASDDVRDSAVVTYSLLLGVACLVAILDQVVKAIITQKLKDGRIVDLLGGLIRLDYTSNTGAAFGFFRAGSIFFAVIAALVSVGIIAYYRRASDSPLSVRTALGLILGGAIGNLIDRVRLGYVVDFIDLRFWPVFNLADSAIVLGVSLLFVHALLRPAVKPA
jgi:signal peptidase II